MVTLILAAVITAAFAWSGYVWTIPASLFFVCLWAKARRRRDAALVALAYFGTASRGLAMGAASYFHSVLAIGVVVWLAGMLTNSLPWALLWARKERMRVFMAVGAITVTAFPPFGIVGWVNPITAAGVLFPGWKWLGLGATTLMMMGLCALGIHKTLVRACAWQASIIVLATVAVVAISPQLPSSPPGWHGYSTHYTDKIPGQRDYFNDYFRLTALCKVSNTLAKCHDSVVVFPESACGSWGPAGRMVWQTTQKNISGVVLFGADVSRNTGKYDNDLILLDHSGDRIVYQQRMPVPIAMWQPWSKTSGVNAYWFKHPVFKCGTFRASALICYEQFLVWPVLESMDHHPQVLIAIGNMWWAKTTNLTAIQREVSIAWARLFGTMLVSSINL